MAQPEEQAGCFRLRYVCFSVAFSLKLLRQMNEYPAFSPFLYIYLKSRFLNKPLEGSYKRSFLDLFDKSNVSTSITVKSTFALLKITVWLSREPGLILSIKKNRTSTTPF